MQTYPVAGYRTPGARAYNPLRGFQTPMVAPRPANDNRPPWIGNPANDNKPVRPTPRQMKVLRTGGRVLSMAAANHPAMRAARIAWELNRWLKQPLVGRSQGTALELRPNTGWNPCWADCGPHPTRANRLRGWASTTAPACSPSLQCLNGQGAYPQQNPVGGSPTGHIGNDPGTYGAIPHHHQTYYWSQGHDDIGSQDRWRHRQILTRTTTGPALHPYWFPVRYPIVVHQQATMPLPWAVLPHQQNSPFRQAGYDLSHPQNLPGQDLSNVRHQPPGRGVRERKMTLMSGGALRNAVEQAFEAVEWVGIINDALPDDCKAPGSATAAQQFGAIWNCWDRIDPCKVIEGAINNWIEDQIVGAIGQAAKSSAQQTGKAYGLSGITKRLNAMARDSNGGLTLESTMPFSIPKARLCV